VNESGVGSLTKEELELLIVRAVDKWLKDNGVLDRLAAAKVFFDNTDAAFNLIESDPHTFGDRPCATCKAVSVLLKRPFGCMKLR